MSAVKRLNLISVEDYLAGELVSPVKHEYIAGVVYAMAGGRNVHNRIATNCTVSFGTRLRGKKCQPYNSDTKVRVQLPTHVRFYYPDVTVVCQSNGPQESYQDAPVVIVEVVSQSTRRTDEGEKKDAYTNIASLSAYLVVEQDSPAVVVHRRTEHGFVREVYQGLEATVELPEIKASLLLAEIYEGVEFSPEIDADADEVVR